ncbi:MAG TPA: transporter [Pyrinomonadaceae bacterium]|nr:transporter [Pyrinomonadaceae bacterium]
MTYRKIANLFYLVPVLFCGALHVCAQTPTPTPEDGPDFIVPARPGVSNPAEFQRPGVLQVEFGINANFHSTGNFGEQHDTPLAIRFAVSRRILVELDADAPYSLKDTNGERITGVGDTQLGVQVVLQHETRSHPALAIAYYIKLPTASADRGLGSGRADHSFFGMVSKNIGKTTVDLNAIYVLAGRTSEKGHDSSGILAVAASRNLTKRFGIQGELSGLTRNDAQPGAMAGIGAVTYQISRRAVVDSGFRVGLTPDTARTGFFAGITVGVADLYKRHH